MKTELLVKFENEVIIKDFALALVKEIEEGRLQVDWEQTEDGQVKSTIQLKFEVGYNPESLKEQTEPIYQADVVKDIYDYILSK